MPRGAQRRARRRQNVEQEVEQQEEHERSDQEGEQEQVLGAPASTVGLACVVDASNDLVLCEQACRDLLACNADLLEQARNDVKTLVHSQMIVKLHDKAQDPRRRVLVHDAKDEYNRVYFTTLRAYAYVFECALMSFPRGTPKEKRGMAVAVAVDGLDRLGCAQPSWLELCPNVARRDLQNDMWACMRHFYMEYSGIAISPL
jgi:hypothetical protein